MQQSPMKANSFQYIQEISRIEEHPKIH